VLGENTSTATHIGLSLLVLVLSTPSINPLLWTMEELGIPSYYVSTIALVFLVHTVFADLASVVYYSLRVFMHSILSIFFRSMEVVGTQNIPAKGPVIFTGNHSNQFVDGLQVLCHARLRCGFMIAEKSFNTPIIGHLAALIGCVPVKRAQDAAKKCGGTLVGFDEALASNGKALTVKGSGTVFHTQVVPGDKIRKRGSDSAFKVAQVLSDTELVLAPPAAESAASPAAAATQVKVGPAGGDGPGNSSAGDSAGDSAETGKGDECEWDVLQRVDQGKVFERVLSSLAHSTSLAIFPEGGSSDRSWFSPGQMLTLKPGVAIIAMEAMRRQRTAVPIIPIGMQYFEGDKFRGRCVLEFGPAIVPSRELYEEYAQDVQSGGNGKSATTKLLDLIEEGMKGCLVEAPSYEELETVHMVRRLFARDNRLTATEKQDLNRRFAFWYTKFYLERKAKSQPVPVSIERMNHDIKAYQTNLDLLGLKDYQVRHLEGVRSVGKVLATLAHLMVVLALGSLPMLLLNLPVGLFARAVADKHMAVALAGSNVKIAARDVRLSKMIQVCFGGVPLLWLCYAVLMLVAGFTLRQTALYLFWCPFFSYLAVMATEAGMVDLKDLKPHFLRLFVSKAEMAKLVHTRKTLQNEVREMVKQYGPEMGAAYFEKNVSWNDLKAVIQTAAAAGGGGEAEDGGGAAAAAAANSQTAASTSQKKVV